jgi:subtilisin family serine protease
MNKMFKKLQILTICLFSIVGAFAQLPLQQGWHLLDKETDGYQGISLEKAYQFLKNKKPQTVIVGVIDSGTDTTHEDLKPVLWRNPKEIPGNGKDDDGNGLIDDVIGWNFLGNANGENINKENMEVVRLYHAMKDRFENNDIVDSSLYSTQKQDFETWKRIEEKLNVSSADKFNFKLIKSTTQSLANQDTILQKAIGKEEFSIEELEKTIFDDDKAKRARFSYLRTMQMLQFEPTQTNKEIFYELNGFLDQQEALIMAKEKPFFDFRAIIGDNHRDINDRPYGNTDVMGSESKHGTHVAGIIAAKRNNGLGIDGVADNARIMTVRAVPDGDEYDKDIALAIRYAVDHGAKVINMSFGKEFSPEKHMVDEAIRYAASKDVLLVHAAGNDSKNIDENHNYPSAKFNDNMVADNMITVGASGDLSIKTGMVAPFTNYGKTMVDVLSPGVKIYATVPTGNKYAYLDGTSMAAPVVSGIAALIRGYYPALTAVEVKKILMESVDKSMTEQSFAKPGTTDDETMAMKELCVSGGIVNAYNALVLAEKTASAKKK